METAIEFKKNIIRLNPMTNGTQIRIEFEGGVMAIVTLHKTRGLVVPRRKRALFRKAGLID